MNSLIPASEIPSRLCDRPAWRQENQSLVRPFTFGSFAEAMSFVHHVADLAEAAKHHPDIDIRWNKVLLRLSTHDAGGLTAADFDLARQIDGLHAGAGGEEGGG